MNFVWAFLVGGLICVVGQLLIDLTKLTPARILVLYVVAGVVLSGTGHFTRPVVTLAKAIASKVWNTASPAAGGVCMIRLAIRPAKSLSNQPTGCRITCRCARQRIIVPKFGRIVLCSNATLAT